MQYSGPGKVLRIYLNKYMQQEKELLYGLIVKKAHALGIAGAMIFQGVEGFGFCCPGCRTLNLGVAASICQPLLVEFVDTEEKIQKLHAFAQTVLKKGAMVMFSAELSCDSFSNET